MQNFSYIKNNLDSLSDEIERCAARVGISLPKLVCVTKSGTDEELLALASLGVSAIGENRPGELKRKGELPKILTFSMAAFIAFYCGAKQADGSFAGVRALGNEYPIVDDQFVLDFFAGMEGKSAEEIAKAVLTNEAFWGEDLTAYDKFLATVEADLAAIAVGESLL